MKKYLKIFFCLSLIFLLIIPVISCNNDKKDNNDNSSDDNNKLSGSITFWLMPNADASLHIPWLDKKAEEFKEKTGVTVKYEIMGWGDAWNKLAAAVATGEGADVFQVGTTWNPQLAATGGLLELDLNEFGGEKVFIKASADSTRYKGKYWGVPWFAETRCLFYNKDMFKEAGVEPPKTYEELKEVGKKIIEKHGKGKAIAIAGTNAWDLLHNWAVTVWAYGGSLYTPDYKKSKLNSPEAVKAMEWYISLLQEDLASKACAEYNTPQATATFKSGGVAMSFMNPGDIPDMEKNNPDLPWGIVEPPKGSAGKASFAGGSNLAVLKASKNKKAAIAWLKFLNEKQNSVEYTRDLTKMLPALVEAYNDPFYQTPTYQVFKTTIDYATAYAPLGVWGDIENIITSEFKDIITLYASGQATENTIMEGLTKATKRMDAALAKE